MTTTQPKPAAKPEPQPGPQPKPHRAHLSTPGRRTPRPLIPLLLAILAGSLLASLPLPFLPISLALLAATLAALRSSRATPRLPLATPLLLLSLTALTAARAAHILAPTPETRGRWHAHATYDDTTRGHLSPHGQRLSIPAGALLEDEEVQVLEPHSWSRPVTGPVLPPAGLPEPTLLATPDNLVRLRPPTLTTRLLKPLDDARTAGLSALQQHPDPRARALLAALLFGHRSDLKPTTTDLFTRTGTRHLLAISGFHIAILAVFLCSPLAKLLSHLLARAIPRLRGRRLISPELLRAVLILTLVPLSGSGAPVLRAACAWALASLAALVPTQPENPNSPGRRPDALSAWCLALLLELLANPNAHTSISIQLSYAATLGLILAAAPLQRIFQGKPTPRTKRYSLHDTYPKLAIPLALLRRLQAATLTAIVASIVAILATTPITWHHFGELSPIGVLATPLAALLITPLLLLGWLDILLSPLLSPLLDTTLLHSLTSLLTQTLIQILTLFDQLPATPTQLPPRPQALIALACWTTLLAFRRLPRRRLLITTATLAWLAILFPRPTDPTTLELHALNVGHGTCIVFRAPGSRTWIFDAGSRDRAHLTSAALFPLLRSWGNPQVAFICSHADADHIRAFPRIASRYPPELWLGATPKHFTPSCPHLDLPTGTLHLTDGPLHLSLHRGLNQGGNEGSRHLVIQYKSHRLVLSGDAEQDGLDLMLHHGDLANSKTPTDLLLIPHHGSDSPWISSLLDRLQPTEIWTSCSTTPQLAPEFQRRNLNWKSTHTHGPLTWQAPNE